MVDEKDLVPEAWSPEMLKDENFRDLYGCLATVYNASERKVTVDKGAFERAKTTLAVWLAKASGWRARNNRKETVQGLSRDRYGRRLRPDPDIHAKAEGRDDGTGDGAEVGRRSGGIRDEQPRPAAPKRCPTCLSENPRRLWRMGTTLVCMGCVKTHRMSGVR